jgi:hypothetical protein
VVCAVLCCWCNYETWQIFLHSKHVYIIVRQQARCLMKRRECEHM